MEMRGEYRVNAGRDRVWLALNDPEVLRQCIPGCEEIEKSSDTNFTAKVTAKVGPVKARFAGAVTLTDLDPPNGYRISGEGSGGAAGFAKGGAVVTLSDDGDICVLRYEVQANVGGKLAQIGSRLIDATARKMADDFFGRLADLVSTPLAAEGSAGSESSAPDIAVAQAPTEAEAPIAATLFAKQPPSPQPETAPGAVAVSPVPTRAGLQPAVWIALVVVAIAALLYLVL